MATAQAIREQEKTVNVSLLRGTIFTFRNVTLKTLLV